MQCVLPDDEVARLGTLRSYRVLDTPPEPVFDDITHLAAYICGTPIALLGFMDLNRLWFKSRVGWDVPEVPREMSFCSHTILQSDVLIAPDTLEDQGRLADCPLATHGGVRFYAGATLLSSEGYALGTLCVMDLVPRGLTQGQIEGLRKLARQAVNVLESRTVLSSGSPRGSSEAENHFSDQRYAERCREVLEAMADAVIAIDQDSRILFVNPGTINLFGYRQEELVGAPLTMLMPEWLRPKHLESMRNYLETGTQHLAWNAIDFPGLTKNGEQIALEISLGECRRGEQAIFTAVCRDARGRKTADEERSRLAAVVTSSLDAILAKRLDGTITDWNKGAERIYGYTAEEIIGKHVSILAPAELSQEVEHILETVKRGGSIGQHETTRVRKDGTLIQVSLSVSPIRDSSGTIVGASTVGRDITARMKMEAELRHAQKIEAVGQLAGGIAHEFNNYLGVILGYSELLSAEAAQNESVGKYVREIKTATQHAASLTRQLLAFSRKQLPEAQVLDLNPVIWESHNLLRRLVPANIEVVPVLATLVGRVKIDPAQLQHILVNLLVNARDAMPNGGKVFIESANAELDEAYASQHVGVRPGSYVRLSITDSGVGIKQEARAHLFEPFYTTKEPGKGTGLGLSTVYGMVKQAGGYIEVESAEKKGTSFHLYFPRVEDSQRGGEPGNGVPAGQTGAATILVVEDEAPLRRLLSLALERRNHKVLSAKHGAEAFEIFRHHANEIQVVVTDIMMPHMDGLELKQRITFMKPNVKFVFMSGYAEQVVEEHMGALKGCVFLEKPFLPEELTSKISDLLRGDVAA
jgi:PAS domain S-box-containing protein